MKKDQRPPHIKNLFKTIRSCIESGRYRQSMHAIGRAKERDIALPDALYVLKNGYHEKEKTYYDEVYGAWKYAIRHKLEGRDIRVIISFNSDMMLIITVINLGK